MHVRILEQQVTGLTNHLREAVAGGRDEEAQLLLKANIANGLSHDHVNRLRRVDMCGPVIQKYDPVVEAVVAADRPGQLNYGTLLYRTRPPGPGYAGKVGQNAGVAAEGEHDIARFHGLQDGAQEALRARLIDKHGQLTGHGFDCC